MVQYKSARYYNWEEIDTMVSNWAIGHFPSLSVEATGGRDENSFMIQLKRLKPKDREAFWQLIVCSEEDTPENAWIDATEGEYPYYMPEDVSLKIMGNLTGMQVDVECATYEGVYFFTE